MTTNIKATSMEARFHRLSFHGIKTKYKVPTPESVAPGDSVNSDLIDPDHIQGYARYTTSNGVSYDIFCRSDREDSEHKGWLTICNKNKAFEFRTPEKEFNHPGGMQIVDDFLFVPVEKGENDEKGNMQSYICLYDLRPLEWDESPVLVDEFRVFFDHKAGMLGVQKISVTVDGTPKDKWVFAIHDNNRFHLYCEKEKQEDGPVTGKRGAPCSSELTEIFNVKSEEYDFHNVNLIYYENKLYLFGFRSVDASVVPLLDQPLSFNDYVALYEVVFKFPKPEEPENEEKNNYIKKIAEKHFVTNTTEPTLSSLDIHFRFGAGVTYSSNRLEMYATIRNLADGCFCYDKFIETDTIITEAKVCDTKRCGNNFTINWEKGYNLEFEVFDKKSDTQIEATFSVMEDKTAAVDTYQWQKIQNNETRVWMDGKKSNLYIAELKRADGKTDDVRICIQISGIPYVNCTRKPYDGQKERASYNFSTKHLPNNVRVCAYENYGTSALAESDACFIIKEDKDGTDPVLYTNVKHGTEINNIAKTNSAYIAFTDGAEARKGFTVLFEDAPKN